jgi:hypothetical protein
MKTVKELLEKLEQYDPDTLVFRGDSEWDLQEIFVEETIVRKVASKYVRCNSRLKTAKKAIILGEEW